MANLYVIATPIGNLEDISKRAEKILASVALIISEEPHTTQKLLSRLKITKKISPFFRKDHRINLEITRQTLAKNLDVALVSAAGTPGINDPGNELVAAIRNAGHRIIPVPGANAAISLASVSGFPLDEFRYLGFAPHKKGRQTFFEKIYEIEEAIIFYESPHRIQKTFALLAQLIPGRQVCVGRELTKMYEQIITLEAKELVNLSANKLPVRGEFVIVIAPRDFKSKISSL